MLEVEPKDDPSSEAVVPMVPASIASYCQDVLVDDIRHSEVTTWRVLSAVLA